MCGLVGIFDPSGPSTIDQGLLKRMNDTLEHRGPDGEGLHVEAGLGLGHRRLSIIDLAGGHQPMSNADGDITIVFNGEIYNFPALREELIALGYQFSTHCDTEVIIHGWHAWGTKCIDRLRGMFAFALWDRRSETLTLCRDRLGKKPLYYAELPNKQIIFGSELKALRTHPALSQKIDPRAVDDYFAYGYIPDPKTIYQGVFKLPPAHSLTLSRTAAPQLAAYWDVPFAPTVYQDEQEACDDLIARLKEATQMRMISDVPLGAFLSGGVDSSGVVAMMASDNPEPINTFSIAFQHKDYDESVYADELATRYRTNHVKRTLDPNDLSILDHLAGIYDEPFGDSSALPTYRVCAEARQHVTVCLSGDGGDELFAGYRRYLWHVKEAHLRSLMPRSIRKPLFGALAALYPKLDWAPRMFRAKTTFHELSLEEDLAFFHSISVIPDTLRQQIFSQSFTSTLDGYDASDLVRDHMGAANTDDVLAAAQYTDFKLWLAGGILTKVDRASMASSLEVRAPLLDHVLAEWAINLPAALKLHGTSGKHILKRALEPYVPHHTLYRPKQGFSMPLADWFQKDLATHVKKAVSDPHLLDTGFFDAETLNRLVQEHQSKQRDHSPALWLILMFQSFLRTQT